MREIATSLPRRRTKVGIPASTGTRRSEALAASGLLDTPPEAVFDRLTALARRLLGADIVLLNLIDDDRQFCKSAQGLSKRALKPWTTLRQTPLSHAICRHVVEGDAPLVVADARTHAVVRDEPAVAEFDVAAYLGLPIASPEGVPIGAMCAIQHRPRVWTAGEIDDLRALADMAMAEIALRVRARENEGLIASLRASEARYRAIVEEQAEMICRFTPDMTLTFVNAAYCRHRGLSEADLLGTSFLRFVPEAKRADVLAKLAAMPTGEDIVWEYEDQQPGKTTWRHWIGRAIADVKGGIVEYLFTGRDVTRQREAALEMEALATIDPLTGLRNRRTLEATIDKTARRADADGGRAAVLVLDLDRFKPVNDALGHAAGDALLSLVATRLGNCLREGDVPFRFGGDEFVVVAAVPCPEAARRMAARIVGALERPFALQGRTVTIGASIGIALKRDGETPATLLARADRAMYAVKRGESGERWTLVA